MPPENLGSKGGGCSLYPMYILNLNPFLDLSLTQLDTLLQALELTMMAVT